MADVRKILSKVVGGMGGRRGVTSAEYAILAVGVAIVVGGAVLFLDLNNPIAFAGANLTASQASLSAAAR